MEKAERDHAKELADALQHNRLHPDNAVRAPKPWDAENWLMNARGVAVRSKPYEVHEAALVCKQLAEKSGWLRVRVEEIKREGKG